MTAKERYIRWCSTEENLPIMLQPWWLDAVCAGKHWDVILSEQEGRIVAAMPYLRDKKLGLSTIHMPLETSWGGIWLAQSEYIHISNRNDQLLRAVAEDISNQLRRTDIVYYTQTYLPHSPIVKLLDKQGFRLTAHGTYHIPYQPDWKRMIGHITERKDSLIRRAEHCTVSTDMTAEELYRFYLLTLSRQRKARVRFSREFLLVLERKARRNGVSQIVCVKDTSGQVQAAALVVWDKRTLYYLFSCYTPAAKTNGARERLKMECIRIAWEKKLLFDTCSGRFGRSYGARRVTFYRASQSLRWYTRWMESLQLIRHFLR